MTVTFKTLRELVAKAPPEWDELPILFSTEDILTWSTFPVHRLTIELETDEQSVLLLAYEKES